MALSTEEKRILKEIVDENISVAIKNGNDAASVIKITGEMISEKLPLHHNNNIIISSIILALQGIEEKKIGEFLLNLLAVENESNVAEGIIACIRESILEEGENQSRPSAGGLARLKRLLSAVVKQKNRETIKTVATELLKNMKEKESIKDAISTARKNLEDKHISNAEKILIKIVVLILGKIENEKTIHKLLLKFWDERSNRLIAAILQVIRRSPENKVKDTLVRVDIENITKQLSKNMKEKKGVRAAIDIAKNDLKKKHISEDESVLVDVIIMAMMHMKHSKGRCYVMRHMLRYNQPLFKKVFINIRACQNTGLDNLGISQAIDLPGLKTELLTVENEMKTAKAARRNAGNTGSEATGSGSTT